MSPNELRRGRAIAWLCALLSVVASACQKPAPALPPDVILIVVDTLRAKSLSFLGYERETSPNLARFAEDAVTYVDAISAGTWTVPSHGSLFTGMMPSYHGAERVASKTILATPINPEVETLAQILGRNGFKTGAYVGNVTYLTPSLGFARGFGAYVPLDERAKKLSEKAIGWLDEQPRPTFLFLNILDPHEPYDPPEPWSDRFPGKHPGYGAKVTEYVWSGKTVTPESQAHFRSQYDGEVAFTDQALAELFERLRDAGRYDEALIIVTADHGEMIGEHGQAGHGGVPYEELVHVPLLVKYPGNRDGGTRVERRVSVLGVFATILETVGIPLPDGSQAVPLDRPQQVWVEDVSFAGDRVTVGYDGAKKLVQVTKPTDGTKRGELYDLSTDPDEQRPTNPDDAPDLEQALDHFSTAPRPVNEAPAPIVDPERERKLRDLGYIR